MSTKGKLLRDRSPSTVEASVRQLAAVVNFAHSRRDTLYSAAFSPKPPSAVDNTPSYRAGINELAAMFRYCLRPERKPPELGTQWWCDGPNGAHVLRIVRIILTVAHLDHVPENCADDNLKALCQRCHNLYDAKMRRAGIRERAFADQFDMFPTPGAPHE